MRMFAEYENPHSSHIFFSTWITRLLKHLCAWKLVCIFLRCIWRETRLKFVIYALVFVLLYVED